MRWIKEQDELIAIHGFGRIALAARIDSNDTIFRGEILQLVLENLTREGQAGNEDQRFTFTFFPRHVTPHRGLQ